MGVSQGTERTKKMTATLALAAALLPLVTLVGLMACPPKYLPNYRRGGWGKYAA